MLAIHKVKDRPQPIATDRHVMQGYIDLSAVEWNDDENTLSGTSQVVGNDPYTVTIATTGRTPVDVVLDNTDAQGVMKEDDNQLMKLTITSKANGPIRWAVKFK